MADSETVRLSIFIFPAGKYDGYTAQQADMVFRKKRL